MDLALGVTFLGVSMSFFAHRNSNSGQYPSLEKHQNIFQNVRIFNLLATIIDIEKTEGIENSILENIDFVLGEYDEKKTNSLLNYFYLKSVERMGTESQKSYTQLIKIFEDLMQQSSLHKSRLEIQAMKNC